MPSSLTKSNKAYSVPQAEDGLFGDDFFSFGESFDQGASSPGPIFQNQSPNFQKIFQKQQGFVLQASKSTGLPPLPPRAPLPHNRSHQRPADINRAHEIFLDRFRIDPHRPHYLPVGQENSPNRLAMSEKGLRTSPRNNKGQNKHLEMEGKMLANDKIPRKTKPVPPTEVSVETEPPAIDSTESPEELSATESESTEPYEKPLLEMNEKELENKLAEMKEQWKFEDKNKTKPVLLQEINEVKADDWIAQLNFEKVQRQQQKTLKNAQELRKMHDKTLLQLEKIQQDLETMGNDLEESEAARERLEKKLAKAIKNKEASRAKGGRTLFNNDEEKVLLSLIEAKAKTVLWGLVKFIQSPEEEMQAAKYLIKYGDLPKQYCATKEDRNNLALTFSDRIKRAVFSKRNYTTAEEKKYYVKMWKAGKPTLTVEDLKMCLQRKIETEDDMTKFMLYWEEYLPKQVGAQEWDKNTRYYVTISQAKRTDVSEALRSKLDLVTPEDEAFLVLSIENGLQRWKEEFDRVQEGKKPDADKDYNGLYTSTTSGQNQYGGWSEEGLELFKTYLEMNIEARKTPNAVQLEKNCLVQLRIKWGIQSETAVEHNKHLARVKSARKRGRGEEPMPPMKKVVRTLRKLDDLSDDDDEMD